MPRRQRAVGREPQTGAVLSQAQAASIDKLQRDTEAILTRARQHALLLVSLDRRRTPAHLGSPALHIGSDFGKPAQLASKRVVPLIEHIFSVLENEVERRMERLVDQLVGQLGPAVREEIQSRLRRTWRLERRSKSGRRAGRPKAVVVRLPPPVPPEVAAPSHCQESGLSVVAQVRSSGERSVDLCHGNGTLLRHRAT